AQCGSRFPLAEQTAWSGPETRWQFGAGTRPGSMDLHPKNLDFPAPRAQKGLDYWKASLERGSKKFGTPRDRNRIEIQLPGVAPRPWLRLAHRLTVGAGASERARRRTILDFELLLQVTGASWIWWERSRGCVALPAGSVALIPPGQVHGWGET